MSDDNHIPSPRSNDGDRRQLPARYTDAGPPAEYRPDPYPSFEPEAEGLDLRRYASALVRFKWLFVLALLVAGGASYWVWQNTPVQYTATGSLWLDSETGLGSRGPIQAEGIIETTGWIQLLQTYAVLDTVVVHEGLYLNTPGAYRAAFSTFVPHETLSPGAFELRVGPGGEEFELVTGAGATVEQGLLAEGVGRSLGYDWTPPPGSLPAGATVPFSVQTPRERARQLGGQLQTRMDRDGNFLEIHLNGTNSRLITSVVNALMDRYVAVAAELKRARLDETLVILEDQLHFTAAELAESERSLEEFRVRTISLPSDQGAPMSAGLESNPVFNSFFQMRVELEEIRRDRARLQAALDQIAIAATGEVRIETLELIPAAGRSSELLRILSDLVDARSELRALTDRYSSEYPAVQDVLTQIQSIEQDAIPRVVRGIIAELETQERALGGRVSDASVELQAIPPRTIEAGRLTRAVDITEELHNNLRGRVDQARLAAASAIPDVRVLDRAQVPQTPLGDDRLRLALMIFAGCLGAAVGGAILLDRTDAKFRYATDVSRDIGLDILGSIPRIHGKRGKQGVLNAAQALEAFRELRIHVGFAYGSAGPITLAVSSPAAGEGKSLISSNLAVAFAEVGRRTLLIDGDTRRGDAHRLFGLDQSPGLVDYLKGRTGQEIVQKTAHDGLDFIGCGVRGISTPELLASPQMARFVGTLKRSYDVIIVDCPPLAAGGDALILSTLMGNLAVVIRTGSTEKRLAHAKLDQLAPLPIRILGAVLNDVDPTDGYHYYYASYLPGYEPVASEEEEDRVQLISGGSSTS
jgi:capsular exopolysaccharide synthesis family protein